ncbi:hypothetical protein GQ44DRAFT_779342 [Phaeosphaeriaceae sp. PMI808]|nr:hypothetical protein GQ44DRAFT_779342 [Phaeosphaeriaceae sp. PMI808]
MSRLQKLPIKAFGELCIGTIFRAKFKAPSLAGTPGRKDKDCRMAKNCRMVKMMDPTVKKEVVVVLDERPDRAWPAEVGERTVFVALIPQKTKVKFYITPISSHHEALLVDLLSSAMIRVTYDQARKLSLVDMSKRPLTHAV